MIIMMDLLLDIPVMGFVIVESINCIFFDRGFRFNLQKEFYRIFSSFREIENLAIMSLSWVLGFRFSNGL